MSAINLFGSLSVYNDIVLNSVDYTKVQVSSKNGHCGLPAISHSCNAEILSGFLISYTNRSSVVAPPPLPLSSQTSCFVLGYIGS